VHPHVGQQRGRIGRRGLIGHQPCGAAGAHDPGRLALWPKADQIQKLTEPPALFVAGAEKRCGGGLVHVAF
jgi:hypothetical protein